MKRGSVSQILSLFLLFLLVSLVYANPVHASDIDGDDVEDNVDNCPTVYNPDQIDTNGDGIGDACTAYHCVTNGVELQQVLTASQTNNMYDIIMIEQGIYTAVTDVNTVFWTETEDVYGIQLLGGYKEGCSKRDLDPANTVLSDGTMSKFVLGIGRYAQGFPQVAKVVVEGITLKSGAVGASIISPGEIIFSHNIVSDNKITSLNGCSGVYLNTGNKITMIENVITRNHAYLWGGGMCVGVGDILLYGNIITGNSVYNNLASNYTGGDALGAGVKISTNGDAVLINNVIAANNNTSSRNAARGAGIYAESKNLTLVNNTITGNVSSSPGVGSSGGGIYYQIATSGTANFYNNVIWGNTAYSGGDIYDYSWISPITNMFNNDFDPAKALFRSSFHEGNNIKADPMFVNSANGDYHLTQISPMRNRGSNSAPFLPAEDFEGYPRISEGIADIGADEYNPVAISFSANPLKGLFPLTVSFVDQSRSVQGPIVAWAWDFNNDGITDSTAKNPSFTYERVGNFTVRLTVTDSNGATNTFIKEGYIEVGDNTDSDGDGIIDVFDNCPETYNPLQTDLDADGTGDACDKNVDLLAFAGYSTGLKSSSAKESSTSDMTAAMKDGKLDAGVLVALSSGKYHVMSFRSNVEASRFAKVLLNVYVNGLYKGVPQAARIYAYSADGVSVQSTKYVDFTLSSGWNSLNLAPILHLMDGFGFVKFRVTAVKNWFDISEAYFTGLVDSWEIAVSPAELDFGYINVGTSKALSLTVSNAGSGNLKIVKVLSPPAPFSVATDGCSGVSLPFSATCSVTVSYTPIVPGTFFETLKILSNDGDHPSVSARLTAMPPPTSLSGIVTDGVYHLNAAVTVTDPVSSFFTYTTPDPGGLASGQYWLYNLTPGNFTATFESEGYSKKIVSGILTPGQNTLDVQLTRSSALKGRVTGSFTGQFLSDVLVTVTDSFNVKHTTLTAADGAYLVFNINVGNFTVAFEKAGYITQTKNGTFVGGETQTLDIQLTPITVLTITITSPQNGAVLLSSPATVVGTLSNNASVAVNGIQASVTGNAFSSSIPLSIGQNTITATATDQYGQTASQRVQVTLLTEGSIFGTVTDSSNGLPLSATVSVTDSSSVTKTVLTDVDGKYTVTGLNLGYFTAAFEKSGYVKQTMSGTLIAGQPQTIDIRMNRIQPLTLYITSPQNGTIVGSSPITITGDVTNDASVSVNGLQASVTSGVFSALIPLSEGENAITAAAVDQYGQSASKVIQVTLKTGLTDKQEIRADRSALDFGLAAVGGSKSLSLKVSNMGTADLMIQGVSASLPFLISNDGCSWQTILPITSCWITVTFSPSYEGTFTDVLKIPSNDADHPVVTVALRGNASLYQGGYFLPDTGQNDCFDGLGNIVSCSSSYGQDGNYTLNPPSYFVNSSLTVTDKNTGLMWQRAEDNQTHTWTDAGIYCESQNLDGYTDWRLPTFFELMTIVNYGRANPSIDSLSFPGAHPASFWTSDTDGTGAKVIGFSYGESLTMAVSSANYVRCVRGDKLPEGNFSYNGDGTFTDWDTGLMWAKDYYHATGWNQAVNLCRTLKPGGYADWRLPNIKELLSKTYTDCYLGECLAWSSTTSLKHDTAGAYTQAFGFEGIDVAAHVKSSPAFFRCVRGGWGTLRGAVSGNVTDTLTGLPLSGVTVSVTDSLLLKKTALTDNNGKYFVADVTPGDFSGSIVKEGYQTRTFSGRVSRGQNLALDAQLIPGFPPTIGNINVSSVTSDSATITWKTDQPSDSLVEYGESTAYGASMADPALTTTHTITLIGLKSATTYHFKVTSKNSYGNASSAGDNAFMTSNIIRMSITSPPNGGIISTPEVTVKGTVTNWKGYETGVTVNGLVATIYGDTFVASHVPLNQGSNTITVSATDVAGNTATASVTVSAVTTGNYIRVSANPESGIAPFETTLRIDGSFSIGASTMSVTGPAGVEWLSTGADEYRMRMTAEGVYTFTASASGPDGNVYQDAVTITVMNKTQLDVLLKAKWEGMKGKLVVQDVEGGLSYFLGSSQARYRYIFSNLLSLLPNIASNMQAIEMISVDNGFAEYRIKRAESLGEVTYYIYFVVDENGVWKIQQF